MEKLARVAILAVDDTPANLISLEILLKPLGHEVVKAGSGIEALDCARERDFAVILLDLMMPVLDGIATLERLREIPRSKNTPVILLTAYTPERRVLERAYELGALDFVEKPLSIEVLRAKVSSFVALYQQGREIRRQADALRVKDRQLGILAHDLRTPLAVVLSGVDRLDRIDDPEVKALAARIGRAGSRMERLIDDMLEFARAAAGHFLLKRDDVDLVALTREMIEDVRWSHTAVDFSCEAGSEVRGHWDHARLEQVVVNLLVNAAKYGTGWVSVHITSDAHQATLTVSNGGEVIGEEALEQLFAPFVRGAQKSAGVGLGLYIAREVARAHGGNLRASSDRESTRFTLTLPSREGGQVAMELQT